MARLRRIIPARRRDVIAARAADETIREKCVSRSSETTFATRALSSTSFGAFTPLIGRQRNGSPFAPTFFICGFDPDDPPCRAAALVNNRERLICSTLGRSQPG